MPTGPSDLMGGMAPGGAADGNGPGADGAPGGGQMPPQVVAMVRQYREALARNPDDVEANIGFGNLLFDSSQWERAIEHYQRALAKTPGNADVRVDMSIAYHELGQNDRARQELERVTREQPTHKNAWLNLGVVRATLGHRSAAVQAWTRYLALDPNGPHADAIRAQIEDLKRAP